MGALTTIELLMHQPEDPHSRALLNGLAQELGRADPIPAQEDGRVYVEVVFDDPLAEVTAAFERVDPGWRDYFQVTILE